MASKHDGKRAQENHWVMRQNMARHKSILGFVHKPRQPKAAPPAKPVPPNDAAVEQAKTPAPST